MFFLLAYILNLIKCKFLLCMWVTPILRTVSLATIGVCVFSALASVGALLVQYKHNNNSSLMD